jgi:hypothetical protein
VEWKGEIGLSPLFWIFMLKRFSCRSQTFYRIRKKLIFQSPAHYTPAKRPLSSSYFFFLDRLVRGPSGSLPDLKRKEESDGPWINKVT